MAQHDQLQSAWIGPKGQYWKARDALERLHRMQQVLARSEEERRDLLNEYQIAMAQLGLAGAIAGAVITILIGGVAARMAAFWRGRIAETHRVMQTLEGPGDQAAWLANNAYIHAKEALPAAWEAVAQRATSVGITSGGTGAVGGVGLFRMAMEQGLKEVDEALEREERSVDAMRDTCIVLVHDSNQMQRDVGNLRGRIQRECGIDMSTADGSALEPIAAPKHYQPRPLTE